MANQQQSRHFVLVHGACHGAWCWYKLKPLLESAGHRVTAVDLAASGINFENYASAINKLDELAAPLMKLMASVPAGEKVILVGHSYGGFSSALAMENYPNKVRVAVFLSAFMPDVTHTVEYIRDARKAMTLTTRSSAVPYSPNLENSETTFLFTSSRMAALYQLSPVEDLELANLLKRPTPELKQDFATRKFSGEAYGSVKRVYIVASMDTFPTSFDEWQIHNFPPEEVRVVDGADHMSMISNPHELCQSLLDIAYKY